MNGFSFSLTRAAAAPTTQQGSSYMADQNWLNSQLQYDEETSKLNQAWNQIGTAFDPSPLFEALNDVNSYNVGKGQQLANNAASEFATRANLSGGSAQGAGVVKAQTLLPFLESAAKNRFATEGAAADMRAQAVGMMSDIGKAMDSLRLQYAQALVQSTLANNEIGQRGQMFSDELAYKERSDAEQLRTQRLIAAAQLAASLPTTREMYNLQTGQTIPSGSSLTPTTGTFGIPSAPPPVGFRNVTKTSPQLAALLAQLT